MQREPRCKHTSSGREIGTSANTWAVASFASGIGPSLARAAARTRCAPLDLSGGVGRVVERQLVKKGLDLPTCSFERDPFFNHALLPLQRRLRRQRRSNLGNICRRGNRGSGFICRLTPTLLS